MEDMEKKQVEKMSAALKAASATTGALSDDDLEGVSGGAVLTGPFYILECKECHYQASTNYARGDADLLEIALDHQYKNRTCQCVDFACELLGVPGYTSVSIVKE